MSGSPRFLCPCKARSLICSCSNAVPASRNSMPVHQRSRESFFFIRMQSPWSILPFGAVVALVCLPSLIYLWSGTAHDTLRLATQAYSGRESLIWLSVRSISAFSGIWQSLTTFLNPFASHQRVKAQQAMFFIVFMYKPAVRDPLEARRSTVEIGRV